MKLFTRQQNPAVDKSQESIGWRNSMKNIPVRSILSMPGSWYSPLSGLLASYLSKLLECNINVPKTVASKVASAQLPEGFELASFDVSSLFTMVPVQE